MMVQFQLLTLIEIMGGAIGALIFLGLIMWAVLWLGSPPSQR